MRSDDAGFIKTLSQWAFDEYSNDAGAGTLWMAEHYRTFVATMEDRHVGFAIVDLVRQPHAELTAIAVSPGERGRGVGGHLLSIVESATRNVGRGCLVAHTADANLAALDLLIKHGYRITRRLPRYYVGMYNACELVKHW